MDWRLAYAVHESWTGKELTTIQQILESGFEIITAEVPGNLECDLMREGRLADLYYSDNTLLAQKLESTHVWYFTTVQITDEKQYLLFEGIDTCADIYVNGELSASSQNMFLPTEASKGLKIGQNEVIVHIHPTMLEARRYTPMAVCNAMKYNYASLYIRKAAHTFGWDIMPRIVSAGIWKPVCICERKEDSIREFYFVTNRVDCKNQTAEIRFFVNAELKGSLAQEYSVRVEGHCKDSSFCFEQQLWHNTQAWNATIANCRFWWPKNAGSPELYDTTVSLLHKGQVCDKVQRKLGIRTIQLDARDDTPGKQDGEFCFHVNNKKIFVLGTNWVPLDAFHSQDDKRLSKALALLDDIGCNMVRCWGGNIYESDAFYDFCDEHGILVWQDFAMGCGTYPDDRDFAARLEEEAVFQVKRLRNHASLALWAGDNECDEFYGNVWKRDPNENHLTRNVLMDVVRLHDYAHPYLPSSPYISERAFWGETEEPERHLWGPRDYFKGDFYRNTFCHFASETGYHGFPSPDSLKRFLKNPEKIYREERIPTDEYLVHAASMETSMDAPYAYRINLAYDQVVTLFGTAQESLADFVRQSQISQAEAKKYFIEKFRIGKWKRTGIIWWNLLDGWPQVSDAIVDYYFCKKLAYHYIKRSQEPVCLMFDEPENGCIRLVSVNDRPESVKITWSVTRISGDDEPDVRVLAGENVCDPDCANELAQLPVDEQEKEFYLIEWEIDGVHFKNHYFTNLIGIDYEKYLHALQKCGMDEFEGF